MSKVNILNNPLYQSPYTYLQAAGSDQTDATSTGWHLRWDFLKSLGDNHIAKGILAQSAPYQTTIGFNKPNDFVRIFRTQYQKSYSTEVKIKNNVLPTVAVESGATREWQYNNIVPVPAVPTNTTNVVIRFLDTAQYDALRATMTTLKPEDLIKQYTGIIEIESPGKIAFASEIKITYNAPGNTSTAFLRIESVSLTDSSDVNAPSLSSRKKFTSVNPAPYRTVSESIQYFRLDYNNSYPSQINIETYQDFIVGVNAQTANGKWDVVGDFALTMNDNETYLRLEDPSHYTIDKRWPKYNDSDGVSGAFKVKVDNYRDRWIPASNAANGLKEAVNQYLLRSVTDVKANASLPVEQTHELPESTHLDISYLDMLRLVAIDFHVARMLGVGHIDNITTGVPDGKYVYCMEYLTTAALEDTQPSNYTATHIFMSLPTSRQDYRLPPTAALDPITYGQTIPNGTGQPTSLTDANGYAPFDDVRFVNVHRKVFQYEKPFGSFWEDTLEFNLGNETLPVQYGVEYRKDTEVNFRRPEILHDSNYVDYSGLPETIGIPERSANPVFVHQEHEEGTHVYGLYSINWFSRVSPVSATEQTDFTDFPKRNTLLPPLNFAVQLIQEESPLIFTTNAEQAMLGALPAGDKTLVRATFDWNHIHNNAYRFADRVEFFFKQNAPEHVRGEITGVTQLLNHQVQITTSNYLILSTNPMQSVIPEIFPTEISRFIGGTFTVDQQAYLISNIVAQTNGQNPTFILDQIRTTESWDNNNTFLTTETYLSPSVGGRFLVIENTASDTGWDTRLSKEVYLEKFFVNHEISIQGSTGNNGIYLIENVTSVGGTTEIEVNQSVNSSVADGFVQYELEYDISGVDQPSFIFKVAQDITNEIAAANSIRVYGSKENDGVYAISNFNFNGSETEIEVAQNIPGLDSWGHLSFLNNVPVTAVNTSSRKFTVAGNLVGEINAPYKESRLEDDGTTTRLTIGGIVQTCTVTPIMDPVNPFQRTGAYNIVFPPTFNLKHHVDPEIDWYKGIVRISDSNPNVNKRVMKELQVWSIELDQFGAFVTPLHVVAYDATDFTDANAEIYPIFIDTGNQATVNFHPSYRLYLKTDTSGSIVFDESTTLPVQGAGSKITFIGARSIDSLGNPVNHSRIVPPVPILAQEIVEPVAPEEPVGPTFATRPDFYGKSTFTFDIKINDTASGRRPFGFIFYRSDERKILDTLYLPATVATIIADLNALRASNESDFISAWYEFVNGVTDTNDLFTLHGTFRFPIPDNNTYLVPNRDPSIIVNPFNGTTPPGSSNVIPNTNQQTMHDIVKDAINGAFFPLTEQPAIYKYLNGGVQTSARKPVYRNANGDLVTPVLPTDPQYDPEVFNPFPMAVQYSKDSSGTILFPGHPNYNDDSNDFYVRFTDYKIDGAANNIYFYFAVELTNKLKVSDRSWTKGPVFLVNAAPAEQPGIRKVITQLFNAIQNTSTAVRFEVNPYNNSEGITKFGLFRAITAENALSIRTMDFVKFVDVGNEIVDDFPNIPFPLYGEPLFYKLVAYREIKNELGQSELIPSKPSNTALSSIVDVVNPPAPQISYTNSGTTTNPNTLTGVELSWPSTAYNATYYLYKMNSSGNWVKIYQVRSNAVTVSVQLLNTDLANADLIKEDSNGNTIYHRFRVQVENSSGLLNLNQNELTI